MREKKEKEAENVAKLMKEEKTAESASTEEVKANEETAQPEMKQKEAPKEPAVPKMTFSERYESKKEELMTAYPKLGTKWQYLSEVWDETFPNVEKQKKARRLERQKQAKYQREEAEKIQAMSPEELEEYEKSIPEWKKGALVVQNKEAAEEKKGMYGKLKEKVGNTSAAKKFY